jgi:hypothetical protein
MASTSPSPDFTGLGPPCMTRHYIVIPTLSLDLKVLRQWSALDPLIELISQASLSLSLFVNSSASSTKEGRRHKAPIGSESPW